MSSAPGNPEIVHPVLEAMHGFVLPNLENGIGRIMPSEGYKVEGGHSYSEIYRFGMHQHETYEWVWLLQGSSHINIAGAVHQLYAGDFCLLPPRTLHCELYTPFTQPYQSLWCSYVAESLYCRISSFTQVEHVHLDSSRAVQSPTSVVTLLSVLESEMRNEQPYSAQVRHSLLSSLAHVVTRALESSLAAEVVEDLPGFVARRVLNYLNRHYAQKISLDDIGRAVGMSRNYLCSSFKRETGKTIGESLTEIRLDHAKLLLLTDMHSIQQVSKAVGYTSPEHFCRVFQRHEHLSPSRYGKD